MAPACAPFTTSGTPAGSGTEDAGTSTGSGAFALPARRRSAASASQLASSVDTRPNGSGHASMHRPQPLQSAGSNSTGARPDAWLISVPVTSASRAQASMQRPHALQYSGLRTGFGFGA